VAWSVPLTATPSSILTYVQWNASVRDNLLETAPAKATTAGRIFVATGTNTIAERAVLGAAVDPTENTTSGTYTNLATSGPAVTLTTGIRALVVVGARIGVTPASESVLASFEVTGASAVAAADNVAIWLNTQSANDVVSASRVSVIASLTAGSNTFTMKYRTTGGATGGFGHRHLAVMGL
jgi:hypothetical protein